MNDREPVKMVEDVLGCWDNSRDKLIRTSNLLKLISNVDGLMIFCMAKDGIEADSRTYSKIGLTRKQYYTRLMQLKEAGLIEKKGKLYVQTTMGSFLHENCVNPVVHAIGKSKQMAMLDVLSKVGKFSDLDLLQTKNALCGIKRGGTDFSLGEIGGTD